MCDPSPSPRFSCNSPTDTPGYFEATGGPGLPGQAWRPAEGAIRTRGCQQPPNGDCPFGLLNSIQRLATPLLRIAMKIDKILRALVAIVVAATGGVALFAFGRWLDVAAVCYGPSQWMCWERAWPP